MKNRTGKRLVIIGASGHGRVAMDIAGALELPLAGFVDRSVPVGERIHGHPVLAAEPEECAALTEGAADWFVAIGENAVRRDLFARLRKITGHDPINLIHPYAAISGLAAFGAGVFVGPGAVVNVDARLEDGVILNTSASVDHDGVLCAFSQVSPGCRLAGNVTVGEEAFLGTGASLIPGVTVGSGAVVGAGAVVVENVPPRVTVVGVPARTRGGI